MKIHIFGRFNQTGIGRHAENFYRQLIACAQGRFSVGHTNAEDPASIQQMVMEIKPEDTVIFFYMQSPDFLNLVKCRKIMWLTFETDRISTKWRDHLPLYDAVWVPTQWGRDVLIKCGVPGDHLRVMTEGVDAQIYKPAPVAHDGFHFLCVGKYEKRKGINELIRSFVMEFSAAAHPDVVLDLKVDFFMFPQIVEELKTQTSFDPRIRIHDGKRTEDEMVALYNSADAFVFPSWAEGWGLTCIEAIACGVPLLATNYSGHTEFLRAMDGLFVPIDYAMEPIEDFFYDHFYKEIYAGEPYGTWARPDIDSIRKGMRQIYENHAAWKEKAARASAIIRDKFDWSQTAKRAAEELSRL